MIVPKDCVFSKNKKTKTKTFRLFFTSGGQFQFDISKLFVESICVANRKQKTTKHWPHNRHSWPNSVTHTHTQDEGNDLTESIAFQFLIHFCLIPLFCRVSFVVVIDYLFSPSFSSYPVYVCVLLQAIFLVEWMSLIDSWWEYIFHFFTASHMCDPQAINYTNWEYQQLFLSWKNFL